MCKRLYYLNEVTTICMSYVSAVLAISFPLSFFSPTKIGGIVDFLCTRKCERMKGVYAVLSLQFLPPLD